MLTKLPQLGFKVQSKGRQPDAIDNFQRKRLYDLDKQEFDWRSDHPNISIVRRHDEELRIDPTRTAHVTGGADLVQRRLDYEG